MAVQAVHIPGGLDRWDNDRGMSSDRTFLCVHAVMVTRSVAVAVSIDIAGSVARSVAVARSGIDAHHGVVDMIGNMGSIATMMANIDRGSDRSIGKSG
jgi:hypothetical protein